MSTSLDVERAVKDRYSQAAQARQESLCCPVSYDPKYLSIIPDEIKERDYGCGDPSAFGQCCENSFQAQKVTGDFFSGGKQKERSDELRLTLCVTSG